MQAGWGEWSPLSADGERLPPGWGHCTAAEQCANRPYHFLPELDLVLACVERCGAPVLDLACGNGRLSLVLAQRGYQVLGLDFNAAFIERASEEAARYPELAARLRFEVAGARSFRVPEPFPLIVMMDQSFKYLLTHADQLACLEAVHAALRPGGRFLVEHRCLFRIPSLETGEPYLFTRTGEGGESEEWVGVDSYDPIQQIGLLASRPLAEPEGEAVLEPCRDFTYQELSLLHHVAGFELEEVWHDLDERGPTATYFDAALLLRKAEPWRPGGTTRP